MKFHSDFGILSWFHVPDLVILSCNNTVWYKQNFDEHLLQVLCTWIQNIPHTPKQTERKQKEKNKHWLKGPVVPYRTGATWLAQHVFRVSVGILRRAQKVEALLFRKPIKNIHFKKTPFLKITNFAHFGFITLEFSDIFDPWATLFFQLPLTWNMCFLGVHNLHGRDFAVASIMECVFLGFVLPESWWKYPTRIYWSLYFRNIVKDHRIHFCICFSE